MYFTRWIPGQSPYRRWLWGLRPITPNGILVYLVRHRSRWLLRLFYSLSNPIASFLQCVAWMDRVGNPDESGEWFCGRGLVVLNRKRHTRRKQYNSQFREIIIVTLASIDLRKEQLNVFDWAATMKKRWELIAPMHTLHSFYRCSSLQQSSTDGWSWLYI
jgi:hypothetical protein